MPQSEEYSPQLKRMIRDRKRFHLYGNRANYYPESLRESLGGLRKRRRAAQDKSRMNQRPTGKRGRTLRERKQLQRDRDARWEAQWKEFEFNLKSLSRMKKEKKKREQLKFDKLQERREDARRWKKKQWDDLKRDREERMRKGYARDTDFMI